MKKLICKMFGHDYDRTAAFIETIKAQAVRRPKKKKIKCERCGEEVL